MKHFGLVIDKNADNILLDLETGEILAKGKSAIQAHLLKHENRFTLQLV
jgi:hypothetical protein